MTRWVCTPWVTHWILGISLFGIETNRARWSRTTLQKSLSRTSLPRNFSKSSRATWTFGPAGISRTPRPGKSGWSGALTRSIGGSPAISTATGAGAAFDLEDVPDSGLHEVLHHEVLPPQDVRHAEQRVVDGP